MKSQSLRPHQTALISAALASVVVAAVPVLQTVFLPLIYLNTHVHEQFHAIATVGTGGSVRGMQVFANGSGVTPALGGNVALLASAGYLGASLMGMVILMTGRTEKGARITLATMATVMALGMVAWLRGDAIGIVSGIFWVVALFGISRYAKGMTLLTLTQFIGVQQCLHSLTSVFDLFQISARTETHSDARIMESHFALPAPFWAGLWCVISIGLLILGLRKAWGTPPRPTPTIPGA
jgi:hypothetical protein